MRPVSFVICAAGKGLRFRDNGIGRPKPLIKLKGKTMLDRSIESLELRPEDQLIIISQKSDDLPTSFGHLRHVEWLEIDSPTRGQLDTFLLGSHLLKHDDIVIYNCDTYFTSSELRSLIDKSEFDGLIPCSIQPGLSWSFCEVGQNLNVLKVAEKERISDWASVGYYYFKGKERLLELAKQEVKETTSKETYVAPLYNKYLSKKLKVRVVAVENFLPFGTPEQVQDYWNISFDELLNENL